MLAFSSPRAKGTVDPGPQHAPLHWCTGLRAHRSERMNGSAAPRVGSKKRGRQEHMQQQSQDRVNPKRARETEGEPHSHPHNSGNCPGSLCSGKSLSTSP